EVSPDGAKILLQCNDGLRMVNADGELEKSWEGLFDPSWGPDSDRFTAVRRPPYSWNQPGTLVLVELDGGTEAVLDELAFVPAFATDGSGVAFIRPRGDGGYFDPYWDHG